jgi:uncharacterized protein involved in exopolysaccharide biosynthesis
MNVSQNDIPLTEAVRRILRRKRLIALNIAVGIAIGALIAFATRPIFVSEVVMLPQSQDSQNGAGGLAKRLSGLASVAGLSLGGSADTRDAAIATLSSYQTLSTFISAEGIEARVLRESSQGSLLSGLGAAHADTMWEAVRAFKDHLVVAQAKDSNLVRLSIEWYDSASASKWTNDFVAFADAKLRANALETARGRLAFLQKELEGNPIMSIREVISGMMENELRTVVTAGADKEFTFKVIDPAIPAERRTRPHRLLIITAFALCGLFLGAILAVIFDQPVKSADNNRESDL